MEIIKNVNMLEYTEQSHVYLIQGEENILIDAGFPGRSEKILEGLKKLEIDIKSIKHILLTHHDVDHVGNAKALEDSLEAQLWAPKEDIPYILGEIKRPGIKRIVQSIVKYKTPFVDNYYSENQQIGEIRVIKAPGHTPGHVIFAYKNVLFTGDLFKIKKGKARIMPKLMNWDHEELKKSIGRLRELEFEWICPAHGEPVRRDSEWEKFIEKY